jgi:hypothetical protein
MAEHRRPASQPCCYHLPHLGFAAVRKLFVGVDRILSRTSHGDSLRVMIIVVKTAQGATKKVLGIDSLRQLRKYSNAE